MPFWKKKWPDFLPKDFQKKLRKILGYKPKYPQLYTRAFLHSSFANNAPELYKNHNERLEFLGDLILDAIVGIYLFEQFPHLNEGELTRLKMNFVNRNTLNKLAKRMELQNLIMSSFVPGEIPDDVLGNCMEALIGAVFLDKGFEKTQKIVLKRFFDRHLNILHLLNTDEDYKSKILLWAQKNKKKIHFQLLQSSKGRQHELWTVELLLDGQALATGSGRSRKQAEQEASRRACDQLHL
ncbi:MAG: ribonuclease III [Flavobacteriales bacterium]|nr:ribonuclease III [Flavobacteriales bacterium]MDW8409764.1 ribonuclease III [Flavobacteriales bacterium]